MKFLADMGGVSMVTVAVLREAGEEIVHLREQGLFTLPDEQILAKASREQSVIVTFDLDFGELLAASRGVVPSVILFRMRNQTARVVNPKLLDVIERCRPALEAEAPVPVEDVSFRLRRPPIQ